MDSHDPWASASPNLYPLVAQGSCPCAFQESLTLLMALPARQSPRPAVDSSEVLSFAHTVSCPVTSSELMSLDIRDLGVRVQKLLFQTPCEQLDSPIHIRFYPGEYSAIFPFDYLFLLIVDLI